MSNGRGDSYEEQIESGRERWVSAMPAGAIKATAQAAEAVRTANHDTLNSSDFDHQDLYRLIGELSCRTRRLPQLIDQAGAIGRKLHADERIDTDQLSIDHVMATWNDATLAAVAVAQDIAQHIDRALAGCPR